MNRRGFTLIELLVVIAIIGILSSIVLASLNTARGKGSDAAAKENLNNMRAQAELVYDSSGQSYATVCANTNVTSALTSAGTAEGFGAWSGTSAATLGCQSVAATWVAWVRLDKGAGSSFTYCADNTGMATTTTTGYTTASTKC